jgi:hypothetical protein
MARFQSLQYFVAIGVIIGLVGNRALSAPPAVPAPAAVHDLLAKIDRSANNKKLVELDSSFAPSYTIDGLQRPAWLKELNKLWQRYPNLRYQTVVQSWKPDGANISVETMTTITGSQTKNDQTSQLKSQLRSRQKISSGQIIQQQILSENTTITRGSKPPTVEWTVPNQLKTNENYHIDAIVTEPLGDDVLLGTVVTQPVSAEGYTKPIEYSLDPLATGGLFKQAKAPNKPGDYWLSATFVRPGGMTTVTRRIHVVRR